MVKTETFMPIILGTDNNAYGIARSLHEAFHIKPTCFGRGNLIMTRDSKIVNVIVRDFSDDEEFVKEITKTGQELKKAYQHLIIIAASDQYAEQVIRNKSKLEGLFDVPFIDQELLTSLTHKDKFYKLAEDTGLPIPGTQRINVENHKDFISKFDFPVALKPANTTEYLGIHFDGKKKAFIIDDAEELASTVDKIYQSGYSDTMILQEFIPGDDSHMRTVNAYVDHNGQVRMMVLGHPVLEDVTPNLIGNYVAIINDYNEKLYKQIKNFLETIKFHGFVNFDLKYDARDEEFKAFDVNVRPGRSSYFTTASGYNIFAEVVKDLALKEPFTKTIDAKADHLWLGVPKKLAVKYIEDEKIKAKVQKLIKEKKYSYTLYNSQDKSIKRNWRLYKYYHQYWQRYQTYFTNKENL